jgi:SAM-dependent methyltransferase
MDRKQRILRDIDPDGLGLEIGPSHNPVAPKREGYRVQIVDHLSREQLKEKYRGHNVDLENIEEVDFVSKGDDLSRLVGSRKHYDWIIACHVVEHMPDLVGFLNECDELLKDGGALSLAVPDKRYCFDRFRPITGISRIIDSHLSKPKIHSAGSVAEYFLNVVSRAGSIAWTATARGPYDFVHTLQDAESGMRAVLNNEYLDVHAWCFVPHSFRLIVHDLNSLGLIQLKEVSFLPTDGGEFYMTLGRHGTGPEQSRLELLQAIDLELVAGCSDESVPVMAAATSEVGVRDNAVEDESLYSEIAGSIGSLFSHGKSTIESRARKWLRRKLQRG